MTTPIVSSPDTNEFDVLKAAMDNAQKTAEISTRYQSDIREEVKRVVERDANFNEAVAKAAEKLAEERIKSLTENFAKQMKQTEQLSSDSEKLATMQKDAEIVVLRKELAQQRELLAAHQKQAEQEKRAAVAAAREDAHAEWDKKMIELVDSFNIKTRQIRCGFDTIKLSLENDVEKEKQQRVVAEERLKNLKLTEESKRLAQNTIAKEELNAQKAMAEAVLHETTKTAEQTRHYLVADYEKKFSNLAAQNDAAIAKLKREHRERIDKMEHEVMEAKMAAADAENAAKRRIMAVLK